MRILVLTSVLVAAVSGAPSQGYAAPPAPPAPLPYSGGPGPCGNGQVLNVDGSCVTPKVHRQVYVFTAPPRPRGYQPLPPLPKPEVITNILFIRVPEKEDVPHVVVPPPTQKNIVYVLNKRQEDGGPRIIEVPTPPATNPEVYFVNYNDGENPTLPGGIDLQTALNSAAHAGGQVIGNFNDNRGDGYVIRDDVIDVRHQEVLDGGVQGHGGVIIGGGGSTGVVNPSGLYGSH